MFKASTLIGNENTCKKKMKNYLKTNAEHLPERGLVIYEIRRPFYHGEARLLPDGTILSSDYYTGPTGTEPIDEFIEMFGFDALSSAVKAVGNYLKEHNR